MGNMALYNPAEGNSSYTAEDLDRDIEAYYAAQATAEADVSLPEEQQSLDKIKDAFLRILMKGGSVSNAVSKINKTNRYDGDHPVIGRKRLYALRKKDPEFRAAWDEAYDIGTDS